MTCETKGCEEPPDWRCYWPGSPPILQCDTHARQMTGVAEAMSFYLHVELLMDWDSLNRAALRSVKEGNVDGR